MPKVRGPESANFNQLDGLMYEVYARLLSTTNTQIVLGASGFVRSCAPVKHRILAQIAVLVFPLHKAVVARGKCEGQLMICFQLIQEQSSFYTGLSSRCAQMVRP